MANGGTETVELQEYELYVLENAQEAVERAQRGYDYVKDHTPALTMNPDVLEAFEGELEGETTGIFITGGKRMLEDHVMDFVIKNGLLALGDLIEGLNRLVAAYSYLHQAQYHLNDLKTKMRIVEDE